MNVNDFIFWVVLSIVANTYLMLILLRRWPQLRFRVYVMNLVGMSTCAYSLLLTAPDLIWTGAFILNLAFQNIVLIHPVLWKR